jgi:hypothetical protein
MNLPKLSLHSPCRTLALVALVGACTGWTNSASATTLVHTGAHCRSTGATTETSYGELINDTLGVNPGDTVLYVCPMVMARNVTKDSATVKVIGAINFRYNQSYCVVRSMNADGSLYHQSDSVYFNHNQTNTKQVDSITLSVNLIPFLMANSVHLRCRLTSNSADKPKNSIIMYWVEQ